MLTASLIVTGPGLVKRIEIGYLLGVLVAAGIVLLVILEQMRVSGAG